MIKDEIEKYESELKNFKLPRIEELPVVDLYMDQVIEYTKRYFKILELDTTKELITSSMINNYVKNGIIPAPCGKKYKRRNVAYIISVFFLKQILSLDEVKALIENQVKYSNEKTAYLYLCEAIESELSNCCNHHYNEIIKDDKQDYASYSLKYSARGIANKIYAQHIIEIQRINELKNSKKPKEQNNKETKKSKDAK